MAIVSSRVIVGTGSGTLVATNTQTWGEGGGRRLTQRYLAEAGTSSAGTYFVDGGTAVSTTTGFPLILTAGAAPVGFELEPGESLYAIGLATGTFSLMQRGN